MQRPAGIDTGTLDNQIEHLTIRGRRLGGSQFGSYLGGDGAISIANRAHGGVSIGYNDAGLQVTSHDSGRSTAGVLGSTAVTAGGVGIGALGVAALGVANIWNPLGWGIIAAGVGVALTGGVNIYDHATDHSKWQVFANNSDLETSVLGWLESRVKSSEYASMLDSTATQVINNGTSNVNDGNVTLEQSVIQNTSGLTEQDLRQGR